MATRSPESRIAMMKLTASLVAALFAVAAQAAPTLPAAPASQPAPVADGAPKPDATPRLAYGFLMKHGEKLVFAPCRDRSYALLEDVSADRQVTRGLEMAGLADGRKYYVEVLGVADGNALRASELNLARAEGRCQKPGGSDEAWLASGNEPGWALAAGGEKVTLQRQGGKEISVPYRAFARQGEVAQFTAEGLELRFERQLCRDSVTEAVFGWTATVRVDGQTLRGCALVR
jgi:putative lipoprotein